MAGYFVDVNRYPLFVGRLELAMPHIRRVDEGADYIKLVYPIAQGAISDFESGEASSAFGAGWQEASDQVMGGSSTASIEVVEGGADGTARALRVRGEAAPTTARALPA